MVASRVWADGMIAGRGWIAVALVVFAQWSSGARANGALLPGAADALLPRLLAIGADAVPIYLMSMLPYLLTILVLTVVALIGAGRAAASRPPRASPTCARTGASSRRGGSHDDPGHRSRPARQGAGRAAQVAAELGGLP